MKKIAMILLSFISLIAICSWNFPAKDPIKKAEWLIGTWENKSQKGSTFESWRKLNDTQLLGRGFSLNGKDTVELESIKLVQEQNQLFFIPTVKNQNGDLPVRFALKKISNKQLIFENPEHDFPQIISYTQITQDSLIAEISGVIKGKERRLKFPMKRLLK